MGSEPRYFFGSWCAIVACHLGDAHNTCIKSPGWANGEWRTHSQKPEEKKNEPSSVSFAGDVLREAVSVRRLACKNRDVICTQADTDSEWHHLVHISGRFHAIFCVWLSPLHVHVNGGAYIFRLFPLFDMRLQCYTMPYHSVPNRHMYIYSIVSTICSSIISIMCSWAWTSREPASIV